MKTKILSLAILALLVANGAVYFATPQPLIQLHIVVSLSVLTGEACLIFMLLQYAGTLAQSTSVLVSNDKRKIPLSFKNFKVIDKNYVLLKQKLELSAAFIASLGRSTNERIDPLIANDKIGEALVAVQSEMRKIQAEEHKRKWITDGIAKFSEILRNKVSLNEYAYHIINNLVKYIGANQGALFIEFENDADGRYLEMAACYAYERRQYHQKKILAGEGLLGQCMLEKDMLFLKEIPKEYIKITSGLGQAVPRNIVVVPLVVNEKFYGAVELALFNVMEPHQVEFVKKIAESIAAEIASIKSLENTQKLLSESNVLAQELQMREEQMHLNLKKLAATQQEMEHKQMELTGVFSAIDSTLGTIEFDVHGNILRYNTIFQSFFGYSTVQLRSYTYKILLAENPELQWTKILDGETHAADVKAKSMRGDLLWLSVTFTPVRGIKGELIKVLCMVQDVTLKKNKEREFQRLSLVANNTDNSVIITDKDGITEYVNAGFTKMTGYAPHEIIGRKPGDLLQGPLTDKETIQKLSNAITEQHSVYEEILNYNKNGDTYWVSVAINPVKNEQGLVVNFISIQANITHTKIRALDFTQKMDALSRANAIIEIDADGNIIDINKNYLDILGYTKEELVGRPYNLITRHNTVYSKIVSKINEGGIQSGVYSRYDKAGNRHFFKLTDYPVYDYYGNIKTIIEFGMDVTNEKRLEVEAEKKRSELNSYLAAINNTIASAEFDLEGNFISGNDIFLKVTGLSATDAGKHITKTDMPTQLMWDNLKEGKFFAGEFTILNKDDDELWLTGTFNPICTTAGEVDKIMMLAQFTTQEKEKLNDLNTMVHALKATLPVVELNESLSCKTANEKFLKMFGVSRLEIRNKNLYDFIDKSYHQFIQTVSSEMLTRDFTSIKLPVKCGDESIVYEVSLSISRKLNGSVSKLILIFIREVEEELSVRVAV
jgi:PAS domain S-box-containing protein